METDMKLLELLEGINASKRQTYSLEREYRKVDETPFYNGDFVKIKVKRPKGCGAMNLYTQGAIGMIASMELDGDSMVYQVFLRYDAFYFRANELELATEDEIKRELTDLLFLINPKTKIER